MIAQNMARCRYHNGILRCDTLMSKNYFTPESGSISTYTDILVNFNLVEQFLSSLARLLMKPT